MAFFQSAYILTEIFFQSSIDTFRFWGIFCNREDVYTVYPCIVHCDLPWTYIKLDLCSQNGSELDFLAGNISIAYNQPRKNNPCQYLPHRKNQQLKEVSYMKTKLFLQTVRPVSVHQHKAWLCHTFAHNFLKYVTDMPVHDESLCQFVLSARWWWLSLLLLLDNSVLSVHRWQIALVKQFILHMIFNGNIRKLPTVGSMFVKCFQLTSHISSKKS